MKTILEASNYAVDLLHLQRYKEAKSLMRQWIPVARRVLGDRHEYTMHTRRNYAGTLYKDEGATLDDLREAVTTLEDTARTARRVLGGANPTTTGIETALRQAQAALRARETPPSST